MDTWTGNTDTRPERHSSSLPPGHCRRVDFKGKIMGGCQGISSDLGGKNEVGLKVVSKFQMTSKLSHLHEAVMFLERITWFLIRCVIAIFIWLAFKIPGLKDHIKWVQLELKS